jgi:hypothetical protein
MTSIGPDVTTQHIKYCVENSCINSAPLLTRLPQIPRGGVSGYTASHEMQSDSIDLASQKFASRIEDDLVQQLLDLQRWPVLDASVTFPDISSLDRGVDVLFIHRSVISKLIGLNKIRGCFTAAGTELEVYELKLPNSYVTVIPSNHSQHSGYIIPMNSSMVRLCVAMPITRKFGTCGDQYLACNISLEIDEVQS